jgi:hypothetical protein
MMKRTYHAAMAFAIALLCSAMLVAGCNSVDVAVRINEDGTGTRVVRTSFDAELDDTSTPSLKDACSMFGIGPSTGWAALPDTGASRSGKPNPAFERTETSRSEKDWASMSGDISIRGSLAKAQNQDLLFSNDVVFSLERKEGVRTYSYRESFTWPDFMAYFTDFECDWIFRELKKKYPSLRPEDAIELKGLLAGTMAMAMDLQAGDKKCEGADDSMEQTVVNNVYEIIRKRSSAVTRTDVSAFFDEKLDASNDAFEVMLKRDMPGAYLATQTEIELRVTFPGVLVDSNAKTVDGHVASWTIHPVDAITRPMVLYLRSEVLK